MNPKSSISSLSLLFLSFFLFSSAATAFNITRLLSQYPEFSTLNNYLTQTQLNTEINSRRTITVLAVENGALSSLSGNTDMIKKVLSLHVILDYYDVAKLEKLSKKTALLTTLFQASGGATGQQGFLNVSDLSSGEVAFGSAVQGSALNAKLVKSVAAQPYNISVLQISSPIEVQGLGIDVKNSSSSPSSSPTGAPPPVPSTKTPSPAKAPSAESPETAKAPAPSSDDDSSDAPSDAPSDAADAPSDADAPAANDAPLGSPPLPADGPTADGPSEEASTAPGPSDHSSATCVAFGAGLAAIMGLLSSLVAV